jgi:hypothetical protein
VSGASFTTPLSDDRAPPLGGLAGPDSSDAASVSAAFSVCFGLGLVAVRAADEPPRLRIVVEALVLGNPFCESVVLSACNADAPVAIMAYETRFNTILSTEREQTEKRDIPRILHEGAGV